MTNEPVHLDALRAPLGVITSWVAALDEGGFGPLAPQQQRAVQRIADAALRAHRWTGPWRSPLADAREVTLARRSALRGRYAIDVVQVPHVLSAVLYDAIQLTPRGGAVTVGRPRGGRGPRGDPLVRAADRPRRSVLGCGARPGGRMARVTGIGGVFFKARDPEALNAWYRDCLGMELTEWGGAVLRWPADTADDKGATVWNLAKADTKWFAPSESSFMINYRIDDMAGILAKLKAAGVEPLQGPEKHENGQFAWVMDPEGNKVELWEPKAWDAKNKE